MRTGTASISVCRTRWPHGSARCSCADLPCAIAAARRHLQSITADQRPEARHVLKLHVKRAGAEVDSGDRPSGAIENRGRDTADSQLVLLVTYGISDLS